MPDTDWYRYCRIMLEWLHPKRDLDPQTWVRQVVEQAKALNVNALAFDIYHGGYAVFNGSIAPKDRHVGDADLLALLDQAVHERDMYLVAMNMGAHAAHYTAKEYPSWTVKGPDGKTPLSYGHITPEMCLNSPYLGFLAQEFAEMLPRYRMDGLYVEGIDGQDCFCETCVTAFERTYGYAIPRDEAARRADPNYKKFRTGITTNFVRRLREVVDAVSPQTVFMPCPGPRPVENRYVDFHGWSPYAHAITHERMWGFGRDHTRQIQPRLFETGLSMQVSKAESGKPAMGTVWLGWHVDRDYSHSTAAHYRLNFAEILLYGATPQLHAQTIFEVDQSENATVREMFDLVENVRPTLLDAHLLPYAALVLDYSDFCVSDHVKGYYHALIEHHVPFEVISSRDLTAQKLGRYKTVVLPDVRTLSDEQIAAIRAYHTSGGGVVMTYRTGCRRPDGSERDALPLGDLCGVEGPFGAVTRPSGQASTDLPVTFFRVTQEHAIGAGWTGRLQSTRDSVAEVRATSGQVIAEAYEHDYSKMHQHHAAMGWYPGRALGPLVVAHERAVYFAGALDREAFQLGVPGAMDMLAQAVTWSAGAPPDVQVQTSPTVEAAIHYSPSKQAYTVLLVNQTTNAIGPGMVVRHVEPIHDVQIIVRNRTDLTNVQSLTGAHVQCRTQDADMIVTMSRLAEYDAVVIGAQPQAS